MTSNQVSASATIGQDRVLGSISQLNADSTSGDGSPAVPTPPPPASRARDEALRQVAGKITAPPGRPYDRYRRRRGDNAAPAGRERLTPFRADMRELQDTRRSEIIVREK
ncbi:hypothetical protein GCM10018952_10880 [Streptosporangium vulgare]